MLSAVGNNFRRLRQFGVTAGAADTDPAFLLYWQGTAGVATKQLTSTPATTLTLVDPDNGSTAITLASYATLGALEDYIEGLAATGNIPGWKMVRFAPRAKATTSALLADGAAVSATLADNAISFWRTASINARRLAFGLQSTTVDANGRTRGGSARNYAGTAEDAIFRDPIRGNVGGDGRFLTYPFCYRLDSGHGTATVASSGTFDLKVQKCSKKWDGEVAAQILAVATTGTGTFSDDNLGTDFISFPGQFFYLELAGTGAISVVDFTFNGQIGTLN